MNSFLRENQKTLLLALPIMAGQVSQMLLGLADTLMVGWVGTNELAAVAFVNILVHIPIVLAIGIATAVAVQVSHAYGAKQNLAASEAFRHGMILGGGAGLLIWMILTASIPGLHLLGQPPEVVAITPAYLMWVAGSMVPMVPVMVCKSFAEARNHPWPVFWILMGGVLFNVLLNYLLIFGKFGFPAMGLNGAGLATFLARCATLVVILLYLQRSRVLSSGMPDRWILPLEAATCRLLFKLGIPISGQLTLEMGAFAVATLLIGFFGAVSLAAHQIAISCAATTFMLPLGLSMALTIRIGHALGADSGHLCKTLYGGAQSFTFVIMSITAIAFVVFGDRIASVFTSDAAVLLLTAKLLAITAIFQIFDGSQIVSIGALRGMKDVRVPTILVFVSFWLVALPLGALLAFSGNHGAVGLWIGLAAGLAVAAAILGWRVIRLMRTRYASMQSP